MSKRYKSVSDKFSQYPKGSIYKHTWTERTPNGDSGLRDSNGYDSRIQSALLQDTRYFEEVTSDTQTDSGDELQELLDVLIGPAGWLADIERLVHAKELEAEKRGRLEAARKMLAKLQIGKLSDVEAQGISSYLEQLKDDLFHPNPQAGDDGEDL